MIPTEIEDHPPSDKLVYLILDKQGPLALPEVAEAGVPMSTAKGSLRNLSEEGHIERRPDPRQPDRKLYGTK